MWTWVKENLETLSLWLGSVVMILGFLADLIVWLRTVVNLSIHCRSRLPRLGSGGCSR